MLEDLYFVFGGIGLFVVAMATLLAAAGARGRPAFRTNRVSKSVGSASPTFRGYTLMVANIGRATFILDRGGALGKDLETTTGKEKWTVDGAVRTEPFGVGPGEVARKLVSAAEIAHAGSEVFRVYVFARRLFGWTLRPRFLEAREASAQYTMKMTTPAK